MTLSPIQWLPRVWDGKQPTFKDLNELNRFTPLVIGFYNDIAQGFEHTPGKFEPTLYEREVEGERVAIEGAFPYVYLDGVILKRSWAGEVKNVSVLVAIGVGTCSN